MIFGATDSPCAACYAVRQCAEDNKTAYPDAPILVARHIYMDDLYVSTDTLEEATNLRKDLQTVPATVGFNLTKWTSNNLEFNQSIPESDRLNSARMNRNTKFIDRVLGVKRNPIDDCYLFQPTNFQVIPKKITQRKCTFLQCRPSWYVVTYSDSRSHFSSASLEGQPALGSSNRARKLS